MGSLPVAEDECAQVRRMAAALIGPDVASAKTLLAVRRLQAASCLAFARTARSRVSSGICCCASRPWTTSLAGKFDALLDVNRLSAPDEPPALGYAWGIAGIEPSGRPRPPIAASAELRAGACRNLHLLHPGGDAGRPAYRPHPRHMSHCAIPTTT